MNKQQFFEELNTTITVGCSLPFSIPQKALDNIVKYAAEWMYRNWDDALDNIYLSIPADIWSKDENIKKTRTFKLPKCIYSVNAVAKDSTSKQRSSANPDYSFDKYSYSNWGVNGGFSGIEDTTQTDAIMGYVIASSWGDLTQHIINYPISYNYNRQTNSLFLKGSLDESPDFLLDCDVKVPFEALYELDLFFNYCVGYAKMQLANILGTFTMNLPGNASINYDRYYDQGKDQVDEVKEEIKSMRGGSDFFFTTGAL